MEQKIIGFIARNKRPIYKSGEQLFLHIQKPTRFASSLIPESVREEWCWDSNGYFPIPNDMFPEITWESEPMEVELTIRPIIRND